MTIKEADQFAVDPLPDVNEKVLVNAEWLQNLIRERDSMRTEIKLLRTTHTKHIEDISHLKHRLMISESGQPYRYIIDTRA